MTITDHLWEAFLASMVAAGIATTLDLQHAMPQQIYGILIFFLAGLSIAGILQSVGSLLDKTANPNPAFIIIYAVGAFLYGTLHVPFYLFWLAPTFLLILYKHARKKEASTASA